MIKKKKQKKIQFNEFSYNNNQECCISHTTVVDELSIDRKHLDRLVSLMDANFFFLILFF